MDEGTTNYGGRRIQWRREGSGPPLLWFEGTPGSRIAWLVPSGRELITLDRPGYGGSDSLPRRTIGDAVEDALVVLDDLVLDEVHVGGWSNGGPHALAAASRLGERCRGVLLVASASPFPSSDMDADKQGRAAAIAADPDGYRAGLAPLAAAVRDHGLAAMVAAVGDAPASDLEVLERCADRAELALQAAVAQGEAGWFADHAALCREDWDLRATDVSAPVVLLHGALDTICPLDAAEALAATIPDATLEVEAQDGHLAPLLRVDDAIARHWS